LVNLSGIGTKNEAVVSVNNEDAVMSEEKTWVNSALLEMLSEQAIAEMKKPSTCGLLCTIEVLLKFKTIITVAIVIGVGPTGGELEKSGDVNVCLWKCLHEVNLSTMKVE